MNLRAAILRRHELLQRCSTDLEFRAVTLQHLRFNCEAFISDWCWTYDPRLSIPRPGTDPLDASAFVPFDLWERQRQYIRWLDERTPERLELLVEKSRDVGITYLNAGWSLHKWLFRPGWKITFGANKAHLVDELKNPDSIFEKLRILLDSLPTWMLPYGFDRAKHSNLRRLVNPRNLNTITGEGGDQMGRGGRASVYFLDEAAFVERADSCLLYTSPSPRD